MFVDEARDLPLSGAPERCFDQVGFGLTTNIRQDLKGLSGTNTLAYCEHLQIMENKFNNPGPWSIKTYLPQFTNFLY
jgi:hypothetical protein